MKNILFEDLIRQKPMLNEFFVEYITTIVDNGGIEVKYPESDITLRAIMDDKVGIILQIYEQDRFEVFRVY